MPLTPRNRDLLIGAAVAVVVGIALLTGPPWWFKKVGLSHSSPANQAIVGMSGGCNTFQVFAQNRWNPVGTAIRDAPSVLSAQDGSFPGNMSIAVNGWVHGRAAYPTNVAPFNNDIWFHFADGAGWVSFAGVRAYPTALDPTGLADGGPAAATSGSCQAAVQ